MVEVGRPLVYKPEYCQELIVFFDVEPYQDIKLPHYDKDGKTVKWEDIKRMPSKLPTLRNFAKKIKVAISTIYNWTNEKSPSFQKEFMDAFICAKEIRKWFLIENGLNGGYNPLFAKFVALNITDMEEKTRPLIEQNITITPQEKNARFNRLQEYYHQN